MKKLLTLLLTFGTLSSFAQGNIHVKDLEIGTEFKLQKDIGFPAQTTVTMIQKGILSLYIDRSNAYCDISVLEESSNYSVNAIYMIKKDTIFKLSSHFDQDISRGSTGFFLDSEDGIKLHMQCRKGLTVVTRAMEAIRFDDIKMDNMYELRVKQMRAILKGAFSF